MKKKLQQDYQGNNNSRSWGYKPGNSKQADCCHWNQATPQVIHNLKAVKSRKRIFPRSSSSLWNMTEYPAGDLPVAPNPTVDTVAVYLIMRREIIKEFNVTSQPNADIGSFNEVMAEDSFCRKLAGEQAIKGADVVYSFAMIAAFPAQILVDICNCY